MHTLSTFLLILLFFNSILILVLPRTKNGSVLASEFSFRKGSFTLPKTFKWTEEYMERKEDN